MCFPKSRSIINYFIPSSIITLVLFSLLLGCSVTKIYQESPPSTDALSGINYIYIYQFSGEKSILFEKILNHEIQKHSYFKNLQILPDYSRNDSAILTVEVTRYYAKDIEEILKQKEVKLVEKEISNKDYSMSNKLIKEFDFVEKVFDERVIHRTLDLEFSFKLTNVEKNKILYFKKENASLKLSYFGGESILLIPDSNDEMARLSQLLIQKFLNKINPKPKEIVIELEKGTNPLPWTFGLVDFGHPRIIRSNYYATGKKYKLALKGWNYVLFEPKNFPKSELFFFNNNVFLRLKKANIPHSILQKLFSIRGKSFNLNEINIILLGLISSNEFETYSKIIKYHARFDQKKDRINLASAHYNLGSIYQIQNEFELAAYHFAKANAYNPQEKYSQSWIEIQHLMGKYNPRDDSVRSIESFLKPPPGSTLFKPKN